MSDLKLSREIKQWQNCSPEIMSMQSEAALRFAFSDMKHDILALHKELERLRSENEEISEGLTTAYMCGFEKGKDAAKEEVAEFKRIGRELLQAHRMSAVDWSAMRELEILVKEA